MKRSLAYPIAMLVLAGCTNGPLNSLGGALSGQTPGSQSGQNGANGGQNDQQKAGAPIINAITTSPSNLVKGNPVTFDIRAIDPTGKPLQFMWSSSKGVLSSTSGQLVSWTPPDENGVFAVQVVAINPDGLGTSASINLIVDSDAIKADAPIITEPGQKLSSLKDRLVANVGGDVAVIDYVHPGEPPLYLTKNQVEESEPTLSPDGSRVAYIRSGNLFMTMIGGDTVALDSSGKCRQPRWKKDGTQILYIRDDKAYTVASKRGAVPSVRVAYATVICEWLDEKILHTRDGGPYDPDTFWLDGESVFKSTGEFGEPSSNGAPYSIAVNETGSFAYLTDFYQREKIVTSGVGVISEFGSWPNEVKLIGYVGKKVFVNFLNSVSIYDDTTGDARTLATHTKSLDGAVSPDGKAVIYVSKNKDPRVGTDADELFAVPSNGGEPTQITFEAVGVTQPSF